MQAAAPELQRLEALIQNMDQDIGRTERFYLQEILEELGQESELEEKLLDEISRSCKAIVTALYDTIFSIVLEIG